MRRGRKWRGGEGVNVRRGETRDEVKWELGERRERFQRRRGEERG